MRSRARASVRQSATMRIFLLSSLAVIMVACSGGASDNGGTLPSDDAPGVDTAPPLETAKNLTINEVAVFQGPKAQVMKDGAATTHLAPIIATRPALIRAYLTPGAGWQERSVTGQLTLHTTTGDKVITDTKTISRLSSEGNLDGTLNFAVDTGVLDGGTTYEIKLLTPPGQPDGPTDGASYGAPDPFNAVWVGDIFHLVLVPYQYNADHSGRTPDTSDAALQAWRDGFFKLWPVPDMDISFHAPVPWNQTISAFGGGWSQVLQHVVGLRQSDGVAANVFYYGIFEPASSFNVFCAGGCVGGLAGLPTGGGLDPHIRGAIGLGYGPDDFALGTIAQELAHTIGRLHAPCGGASNVDPKYPYKGGSIGVWGYDLVAQSMVSPSRDDFMGYCPDTFVSDYTFNGIGNVLQKIAAAMPNVHPAPPTKLRFVDIGQDGTAHWGDEITVTQLPEGEPHPIGFIGAGGVTLATTQGWYYAYDNIKGGMLLVPEAPKGATSVRFEGLAATSVSIPR